MSSWDVENLHGLGGHVRTEMGVPHRHLDGAMAHQLLNDFQRHSSHHQMTGEGVAERVPADMPKPGAPALARDGVLAPVVRVEHVASGRTENERALEMPVILQHPERRVAQWDLARSAVFGSAHTATIGVPLDEEAPTFQVHTVPLKSDQLAQAESCVESDEQHRLPLGLCRSYEAVSFLKGEEVELWLRHLHPRNPWDRGQLVPLNGKDQ